ncbi:primary-amine oxidase [Nocardioides sp. LS1]|uniref:primary-amine oxidase n=1 Tax=Nocardioides sp. LS1 TaxID=1027620 RepID=UPI000FFA1BB9|nr:primary-amine oxidase [Nocardioides sp. LS1]GCD88658.1 amine oxidase [Nocardioides sp. LS1]
MTIEIADVAVAEHPLDPLSAAEITAFRGTLEAAGMVTEATRFAYVTLVEPGKDLVGAHSPGDAVARQVRGLLLDLAERTTTWVDVDVTARSVLATREVEPDTGQGPILDEDFVCVDELCKADARWVDAVRRRGISELDQLRCVALSAGSFGYEDERAVRSARVLAFQLTHPTDSMWAHPVDGVVAHVDLTNQKVLRVVETDIEHVPAESGDYLDPEVRGTLRESLKPLVITQPEGVSFQLEGNVLTWENWSVRLGFNGREGLTLHRLTFDDRGTERPILNRASIAEMVVPYGDPTPTHDWQNYFDVGEYQFGRLANPLELGCDCLGDITYVSATVADDHGKPREIKNAICIHEEDYGILWKHNDTFSGTSEVRRQRRLVVSFFVTVGNYDYGFYWYLYLDGGIELEAKATGIVFTSGHPGGDYPYATEIAPGLGAPVHQHLFSARLDMEVDGTANAVEEIDVARVPMGDNNPVGNAFTRTITRFRSEQDAQREADASVGRTWAVVNTETSNRMGRRPAYVLYPTQSPLLLAADDSSIRRRAAFATKALWVTRYDDEQLWASGELVNQHPGGAGLPEYTNDDRDIDGQDIVLWHTFGLTHFPRLEDWPIMPVDYAGFMLKPDGFFDRNPTLDLPAPPRGHCAPEAADADGGCCGGVA